MLDAEPDNQIRYWAQRSEGRPKICKPVLDVGTIVALVMDFIMFRTTKRRTRVDIEKQIETLECYAHEVLLIIRSLTE